MVVERVDLEKEELADVTRNLHLNDFFVKEYSFFIVPSSSPLSSANNRKAFLAVKEFVNETFMLSS